MPNCWNCDAELPKCDAEPPKCDAELPKCDAERAFGNGTRGAPDGTPLTPTAWPLLAELLVDDRLGVGGGLLRVFAAGHGKECVFNRVSDVEVQELEPGGKEHPLGCP